MGADVGIEYGKQTIHFRTGERWNTSELYDFIASINAMYAILLVSIGEVEYGGELGAFFRRGARLHPDEVESTPRYVTELLQVDQRRHAFLRRMELEYRNFLGKRLRIAAMTMASPGFFSFEGVAGAIEQLREFVKDLWYRNRLERKNMNSRLKRKRSQSGSRR